MRKKTNINKSPSNCPYCNGEREWHILGKVAICYFCGRFENTKEKEMNERPDIKKENIDNWIKYLEGNPDNPLLHKDFVRVVKLIVEEINESEGRAYKLSAFNTVP